MGRAWNDRILGVVDARGAAGIRRGGASRWNLAFTLAAWRMKEGDVVVEPRRFQLPMAYRELESWMERLPPGVVVELQATRNKRDGATILQRIVRVAVEDADLARIAVALRKPIRLVHPALGRFQYDRRHQGYQGKVTWCGCRIDLSLTCAEFDRPAAVLLVAERLFADQADWKRRVDDFMVERLLPLRNKVSDGGDHPRISREEFLARIRVFSIDVDESRSVCFWYSDGDLFGGHLIQVSGSLDEGPTDADIPG